MVPVLVMVPPARPVPAVTEVTVPAPIATVSLTHCVPLYRKNWLVVGVAMVTSVNKSSAAFKEIVPAVVMVPPLSPVPATIDVTVPIPTVTVSLTHCVPL